MLPTRALLIALLVAPGVASRAAADGAWTTYMRAYTFSDLAVRSDAVWCGTREAGVLRFDLATGTYTEYVREPGGLAGNVVAAVTFDRTGRLWVGTLGNGASVLDADGASWRLVNAFDGLPSDSVRVIEADGDTLWLGTTRGLALWNGHEISGVLPDGVGPSPFASDRISGVAVFGDTVWVATETGLYRSLVSAGLETWTPMNAGLPASLLVESLGSDGSTLIVMANAAAWRWDRLTSSWVSQNGLGVVWRLSDDFGRIALSTSTGVFTWNGSGWDLAVPGLRSSATTGRQVAVGFAPDGTLYAADRDGVRLPDGTRILPPGGPGNSILNIEIEGPRVYTTTLAEGVGRLEDGTWRYWFPGPTRSDTTFRDPLFVFAAVTDTAGRKWFAAWARLVNTTSCEPDTGAIEVLDDRDSPPTVTHIIIDDALHPARHSFAWGSARDSSGGIWLGMGSPCPEIAIVAAIGLEHYAGDGTYLGNYRPDNSTLRGKEVRAITVDRDERVWFGYRGQGIDWFEDLSSPVFRQVSGTTGLDVRGLEAYGDSVWAFTTSKLLRYNLSRGLSREYDIPAGPADLSVRPLAVGPDGTAWFGTLAGVRAYRRDGSHVDYNTTNSPLPDNEVRTVRVDPVTGVVWIGTARGLARFDPGYVPGSTEEARLDARVYPNPARLTNLGVGLRLATGAARVTGAVYDLTGRRVRSFSVTGSGHVIWDGRDAKGGLVDPGIYFVRVESGGRTATARVVVLR